MKFIRRFAGAGVAALIVFVSFTVAMSLQKATWLQIAQFWLLLLFSHVFAAIIITIGVWIHHKLND